jgi:hypothetical protein
MPDEKEESQDVEPMQPDEPDAPVKKPDDEAPVERQGDTA